MRLYKCSFSGFLATRPKSAGVWLQFFASLRGKSVLSRRHRHSSLPHNDFLLYHKSDIRGKPKNLTKDFHLRGSRLFLGFLNQIAYINPYLIFGIFDAECQQHNNGDRCNCKNQKQDPGDTRLGKGKCPSQGKCLQTIGIYFVNSP